MKINKHKQIVCLLIKNAKQVLSICIAIIYVFILPLIFINSSSILESEIMIFNYCQQLVMPILMIMLSYLYKGYVEEEYCELITTLDRKNDFLRLLDIYWITLIILLPFYITLWTINNQVLTYIFYFQLQILFMYSLYYALSKFLKSSILSLGIVILYILLFTQLISYVLFANIFLVDVSEARITLNYCLDILIASISFVFLGSIKKVIILCSLKRRK